MALKNIFTIACLLLSTCIYNICTAKHLKHNTNSSGKMNLKVSHSTQTFGVKFQEEMLIGKDICPIMNRFIKSKMGSLPFME